MARQRLSPLPPCTPTHAQTVEPFATAEPHAWTFFEHDNSRLSLSPPRRGEAGVDVVSVRCLSVHLRLPSRCRGHFVASLLFQRTTTVSWHQGHFLGMEDWDFATAIEDDGETFAEYAAQAFKKSNADAASEFETLSAAEASIINGAGSTDAEAVLDVLPEVGLPLQVVEAPSPKTPAVKKRRLSGKVSPGGVRVQTSPVETPAKRKAAAPAAARRQRPRVAAVEEEEKREDWRGKTERDKDRWVAYAQGRSQHYHSVKFDFAGHAGNQRKLAIRKAWAELSKGKKREFMKLAVGREDLEQEVTAAISRHLMFASADDEDDSKGRDDAFHNGKHCLLTYHNDSWVLDRPQWELETAAEPLAAATAACQKDQFVQNLTAQIETDVLKIVEDWSIAEFSVALEICPKTMKVSKVCRLHVHVALVFLKKACVRKSQSLRVSGALLVNSPRAAGHAAVSSRARNTWPLHYYLQMPKHGSVWHATNLDAFTQFPVNPRWITSFVQSGHLESEDAKREYIKCCINLTSNLQNLQAVTKAQEDVLVRQKMAIIEEALSGELCSFRKVRKKSVFLDHLKAIRSRYKFLVAVGDSGTGKTVWLKHMFDDPRVVLEVNCASCPEPDLRELRPLYHKGILFDEASCVMVLKQKKLFQAPPTPVLLGCSTTNCHSYDVFVSGIALMIASNTWLSELEALERDEDKQWLKANSIVVKDAAAVEERVGVNYIFALVRALCSGVVADCRCP